LVSHIRDKTQTHNIYSITTMQIAKRVRRLMLEIEENYRELFVGSFVNYALLIAKDARYHSRFIHSTTKIKC